ncbi:MAG: DUF393 domain-containing protein [bacterium]|nr:DUF393 domain-containing protein [bacterium]
MAASVLPQPEAQPVEWRFRVFFDGACPLCKREIDVVRRLDAGAGRVDLVDLSLPGFDATAYGLEQATIEERIHGMLPDGTIVEGVDVFIHLYEALDRGWIVRIAHVGLVRAVLDRLYTWFARNRLRLTGRAPKTCPVEPDA